MIGPLLAFCLLAVSPLAFHSIFLISFALAVAGVALLATFVEPPATADDHDAPAEAQSLGGAVGLVKIPRFRRLLIAGGALSLATASDAFIFLVLQEQLDLGTSLFPLLFVGSSSVYMLLAVPMGRLADRIGRGRVFLGGYGLLLGVYATVLSPVAGLPVLIVALGLLGAYYAATDGVLMALGSVIVPPERRGSGLALLGTVTSVARLLASLVFGAVWTIWGAQTALATFSVALVAAGALSAAMLAGRRRR
jgi:MFS family permease